ncbi:MAG: hypothetical protein AB8F65_06325 [Woeseiaceae bacterium]
MKWDDAVDSWKASPVDAPAPKMPREPSPLEKTWAKITRRDRLESIVAIAMLPVFGYGLWMAVSKQNWMQVCATLVLLAALVWIPLRMRHARKLRPVADPQMSIKDFLRAEHAAMKAQEAQALTAWLWYVLPISVGAVGFYTSAVGLNRDSLGYAIVVVIVSVAIHLLNYYGAAPGFAKAAEAIDQQIKEIEDLS